MIHEIQIPQPLVSDYTASDQSGTPTVSNRLIKLSKLNIFIGPNNCGKSRLLRSLFGDPGLAVAGDDETSRNVRESQDKFLPWLEQNLKTVPPEQERYLTLFHQSHPRLRKLDGRLSETQAVADKIPNASQLEFAKSNLQTLISSRQSKELLKTFLELYGQLHRAIGKDTQANLTQEKTRRIYIPTLRGLRSPKADTMFYRSRTITDYFETRRDSETNVNIEDTDILTGLELFDQLQDYLLGTPNQRQIVADFQSFISDTFFDGLPVTLMPRRGKNVLFFKLGDEEERAIFEIGDGIQHLLIMTLPIFLHRERPLLLFIEEPELFLHPGFQRVFIETALNRSGQEHQIFVTTHSHQFLDITADQHRCSIYQCRKRIGHEQEKTTVKFEVRLSSSDDFSILRELGVRNSSVLLANCTIWVEGITDRQYFRHYLSLYQKHLQEQAQSGKSTPTFLEDLHFSFVEFGGSNITHWSFLDPENGINVKRLCGTAFVICDRDDGEAKTKRNQKLKEILKDRAHILECREVENLLTPEVITGVVRLYEGDDVSLRAFASNDYKSASLGTFIERCVLTDVAGSRRRSSSGHPYADQSGTLKQKTDFCSKAIKAINDFNDLSEEAKVVTKLLHEFIRTQN